MAEVELNGVPKITEVLFEDALTMTVREGERELARHIERMLDVIDRLMWRLNRLAQTLREDGARANVNSLGEIQGNGAELDRLCGEFAVRRDALAASRYLQSLYASAQQQAKGQMQKRQAG